MEARGADRDLPVGLTHRHRLEGGLGRVAAVIAVDKLVEVGGKLRAADTVMRANEPVLHVPDGLVGERNDGLCAASEPDARRLDPLDVLVTGLTDPFEALEPVRVDCGAPLDVAADEVANGGSLEGRESLPSGLVRDHGRASRRRQARAQPCVPRADDCLAAQPGARLSKYRRVRPFLAAAHAIN